MHLAVHTLLRGLYGHISGNHPTQIHESTNEDNCMSRDISIQAWLGLTRITYWIYMVYPLGYPLGYQLGPARISLASEMPHLLVYYVLTYSTRARWDWREQMSKVSSVIDVKGWNRGRVAVKIAGLDWIIDWLSEGSPYFFFLPYYLLLLHGVDRVSFTHPHATHEKQDKPSPTTGRSPPSTIHSFLRIHFISITG